MAKATELLAFDIEEAVEQDILDMAIEEKSDSTVDEETFVSISYMSFCKEKIVVHAAPIVSIVLTPPIYPQGVIRIESYEAVFSSNSRRKPRLRSVPISSGNSLQSHHVFYSVKSTAIYFRSR